MMWKAVGESVAGTSHIAVGKGCEDAIAYKVLTDTDGNEVLLCCASDGAGSAAYGALAAAITTGKMIDLLSPMAADPALIKEGGIYAAVEEVYDLLASEAAAKEVPISEFSCTLLGCCISNARAAFFQIGDGAIVRNDGLDHYTTIWWPHNGEYLNSTSFLIDDSTFKDLNITIIEEPVKEVALFTDGLQMLALNTETTTVHQPFLRDMFRFVRMAGNETEVDIIKGKLAEYLAGSQVNDRTDDDKTLFLATSFSA